MANEAPINPQLVQAIVAVLDASTSELDQKLKTVLKELLLASLITTADPFPAVVETDDGDYVALFTDVIELHFFEPGARWKVVRPDEIIRRVAKDEFDGLVVYGGGKQLELSAEDVRDMFAIDE